VKENRGGEKVMCNVRSFGNDGYAKRDDTNTFLCNALKFAEFFFPNLQVVFLNPRSILTILRHKKNVAFKILYAKLQIHHIEDLIFIM
jgi:hypothetical protein